MRYARHPISPEILDQPPPNKPALELSLLGSLILALFRLGSVRDIITPQGFHVEANGRIFAILMAAFDGGRRWVDVPRMVTYLRHNGLLREIGAGRMAEMAATAATEAETVEQAKLVRELSARRRAIGAGCELLRFGYANNLAAREMAVRALETLGATV